MSALKIPSHIKRKEVPVTLIIFRSMTPDAPAQEWEPVKPEDVPPFLKTKEAVRNILHGNIAQFDKQSPYWYRAEEFRELH